MEMFFGDSQSASPRLRFREWSTQVQPPATSRKEHHGMGKFFAIVCSVTVLIVLGPGPVAAAADLGIITGSEKGTYYQIGRASCRERV